jgi:tetratricopeptide (TPR) repeat protein
MKILKKITLLCLPCFLVACSTIPTNGRDSGNRSIPDIKDITTQPEEVQTAPDGVVKETPVDKAVQANIVVHSLLDRAQQQLKNSDVQGAESSLARAIRIAPRYPESYYRLAELRYNQGKYAQASSLAEKSISLGADKALSNLANRLLQRISKEK